MAQVFCSVRQSRSFCQAVNIIGFPINWGQRKSGTEDGPDAIRSSGLVDKLTRKGCSVHDSGNLPIESQVVRESTSSPARNAARVSGACQLLSHAVSHSIQSFGRTVVLGGDHSMAIGSIHGHATACPAESQVAVIWIDAHAGQSSSQSLSRD